MPSGSWRTGDPAGLARSTAMELDAPRAVRDLTRRLEAAGYETWAVGGAVRDAVLGFPAGDWDLATRARPNQVRSLFRRTVPIGIEHGTVGVLGADSVLYEVTTFRRDVETFGRHAVVEFADTIDEDLARRDFTFNALAWHPLTGELRDPFGGMDDLQTGRLSTVGRPEDRFAEDYLRVLRALRFAGHFVLAIDPVTWRALSAAAPHLVELSAERIREELWKVLSGTRRASRALSLYGASGALAVLYPELEAMIGAGTAPSRPYDAWAQTLFAIDALPCTRTLLRVAALLHATGATAGAAQAEGVMRRLKASNADTERVVRLVRHGSDLFTDQATDADVRRWLRRVGPDLLTDLFRLHVALWRAAHRAQPDASSAGLLNAWRTARAVLRRRPALEIGRAHV